MPIGDYYNNGPYLIVLTQMIPKEEVSTVLIVINLDHILC